MAKSTCFGVTVAAIVYLTVGAAAQGLYFPPAGGSEWETIDSYSLGYCDSGLDSLDAFLAAGNAKAFILLKDGKIVHERYFNGFGPDSLWVWNSAGKTLMATLVGIAQQEGSLDINQATNTYLGTGWTNASPSQEDEITLRHQLTMTTGLDDTADPDCTNSNCLNYLAPAGTRWAYHNAPYTILGQVIEAATGQSLNIYQRRKFVAPAGITGAFIRLGFNNVYVSDARSMARFGLLTLADGNWDGTPVLADTSYLHDMLTPSQSINPSYGYLWWLNGQPTYRLPTLQVDFPGPLMPGLATDAYAALGKDGQIVAVTPSSNEVWIRMGDAPGTGSLLVAPQLASDIGTKLSEAKCASATQSVDAPTGLTLSPNPAQSAVRVSCTCDATSMHVLNSTGQIVASIQLLAPSKEATLPLAQLSNGTYTVKVECSNGASQHKALLVR